MNKYKFVGQAVCPIDEKLDVYKVTVWSHRQIDCELLLQEWESANSEPQFQEDLTRRMAMKLRAKVRLKGSHSGVKTVSIEEF